MVSLSGEDGFNQSDLRIAEIFERYSYSECFNLLAFEELDGVAVIPAGKALSNTPDSTYRTE